MLCGHRLFNTQYTLKIKSRPIATTSNTQTLLLKNGFLKILIVNIITRN